MEDKVAITLGEVKVRLFDKYKKTVEGAGGTLHQSGEAAFNQVLDATVGQEGTGVEGNWRRDHGFLLEVTERLALRALRYAKKQDHTAEVKRKHVIRAANCLIPDISRYCMKDRVPDESVFQTRGPYCKDWEEMPENGSA